MSFLYLDRLLFPVTALGPGRRIALWVAGCGRHCTHCANPELWTAKPEQRISVAHLTSLLNRVIAEKQPDGLTITGGEPFEQAAALASLVDALAERPEDILIYSGYRLEELERHPERRALLDRTAVLIDGEYLEERNFSTAVLRGSDNQRIIYLRPELEKRYAPYLEQGRRIQNFVYDHRILSVGIHDVDKGAREK